MMATTRQSKIRQDQVEIGASEADDLAGEGRDNQFLTALARGMSVLEACVNADKPLRSGDLAALTGLSVPTASRITYTLYRCGYLVFDARERTYSLGGRALALAATMGQRINIRHLVRPLIQRLALETNFNVGLGTLVGTEMVFLDVFEGESLISLRLYPGLRVAVLPTALGRAYLAAMPLEERTALIEKLSANFEGDTRKLLSNVNKSIRHVQQFGYCASIAEWDSEINALAAPIKDPATGVIYTIVIGGAGFLLTNHDIPALSVKLLEVVKRIEGG